MRDVVIEWFHTAGIKDIHSYAVYSDYPEKERDYKDFCEDNSDSAKIMFSVNMLNEGLHIEDISGVLMLRTTRSNLVYLQQLGRLLEAGNMDKYLLVFDFVNNFSSANGGVGLLREIKDAIAREKESDPDFDDSGFEDIDTYFVIDQVVEIQEMFREIEGRLSGSWDLYIKALKQYKEREGDCLVPHRHIETLENERSVNLGAWVSNIRYSKKQEGRTQYVLTSEMLMQLETIGFIWDKKRHDFEKNVNACIEFYKNNNRIPIVTIKDEYEKKLAYFISDQRKVIDRNLPYPKWKKELLNSIPTFFDKKEGSVERFCKMVLLYKKEHGHTDIKKNEVLDNGYKIGIIYNTLMQRYKNHKLSLSEIERLEELGICLESKFQRRFNEKMKLAKDATNENIIISRKNQYYNSINLYTWITETVKKKYKNGELLLEEIEIVEKLIGKQLNEIFGARLMITKVVDIIENNVIKTCSSQSSARKYIKENYGLCISNTAIRNRLDGKITTPYKGRFMFYYATDEEVKKYLEDSKAS